MISISFLSGCNESDTNETKTYKQRILGAWLANATTGPLKGSTGMYIFFYNGSFLAGADSASWGTYEITNEKLNMSGDGRTFSYNYNFSDNYNKVTLKEGAWTIILTRRYVTR
jgi:hypothetical protein